VLTQAPKLVRREPD